MSLVYSADGGTTCYHRTRSSALKDKNEADPVFGWGDKLFFQLEPTPLFDIVRRYLLNVLKGNNNDIIPDTQYAMGEEYHKVPLLKLILKPDQPRRFYVDIECILDPEDDRNPIVNTTYGTTIIDCFISSFAMFMRKYDINLTGRWYFSSATRANKWSFHGVYASDKYFSNASTLKGFAIKYKNYLYQHVSEFGILFEDDKSIVDFQVYGNNWCTFRSILSYKATNDRNVYNNSSLLIPINYKEPVDILARFDVDSLPPVYEEELYLNHFPIYIGDATEAVNVPEEWITSSSVLTRVDGDIPDTINAYAELVMPGSTVVAYKGDHGASYRLNRTQTSRCINNPHHSHDSNGGCFIIRYDVVLYRCFSDHCRGKDVCVGDSSTCKVPDCLVNMKYVSVPMIETKVRDNWDDKPIIIKSAMGTGKTRLLTNLLVKEAEYPATSMLLVTCRVTLAIHLHKLLNEKIDNFAFYQNTNLSRVGQYTRLVCQLDSVVKLVKDKQVWLPDILVLDEIASLLHYCSVSSMAADCLLYMIMNCKKLICLDADINEDVLNVLKLASGISRRWTDGLYYINNCRKLKEESYNVYTSQDKLIDDLHERIDKQEFPIGIACTSKTFAQSLHSLILRKFDTMDPDRTILYSSSSSTEEKRSLVYCNEIWSTKDIVIFTPTINVGVEYSGNIIFDTMYGFAENGGPCARQFVQMLRRIRSTKSDNILVYCTNNKRPNMKASMTELLDIVGNQLELRKVVGADASERLTYAFNFHTGVYGLPQRDTFEGIKNEIVLRSQVEQLKSSKNFTSEFMHTVYSHGASAVFIKDKSTRNYGIDIAAIADKIQQREVLDYASRLLESIASNYTVGYNPTPAEQLSMYKMSVLKFYGIEKFEDIDEYTGDELYFWQTSATKSMIRGCALYTLYRAFVGATELREAIVLNDLLHSYPSFLFTQYSNTHELDTLNVVDSCVSKIHKRLTLVETCSIDYMPFIQMIMEEFILDTDLNLETELILPTGNAIPLTSWFSSNGYEKLKSYVDSGIAERLVGRALKMNWRSVQSIIKHVYYLLGVSLKDATRIRDAALAKAFNIKSRTIYFMQLSFNDIHVQNLVALSNKIIMVE